MEVGILKSTGLPFFLFHEDIVSYRKVTLECQNTLLQKNTQITSRESLSRLHHHLYKNMHVVSLLPYTCSGNILKSHL